MSDYAFRPRPSSLRLGAATIAAAQGLAVLFALTLDAEKAYADDAVKPAAAIDPAHLEFFEKQVRPIFVARCNECHAPDAKRIEGGLVMNGHQSLLDGGDTGPAVVPGKPDDSLLIDAVKYGDTYQMPPKGKMPPEEIAVLVKWVEMGAPWPEEKATVVNKKEFNLAERKASHWAWQPIADPPPPAVKKGAWPLDPIDNFILSQVEGAGLSPNNPAEPRTLIRRLYFDLIGLPPSPEDAAKWEARLKEGWPEGAAAAVGQRVNQKGLGELVDHLLASPQFGERWGRHWLDLMRYGESRGHEFDPDAANAWQYRDYVIRAFNADLPYDQLITEHIAGDLLKSPRRHPQEGFNESIVGTGFWFLGEWVHSPVEIRKDEADRHDNMIDVFGKTFLGVTIACARCHDHKFDAISQKDYYAIAGYLQSSDYRLARIDTLEQHQQIAEKLQAVRSAARQQIAAKIQEAQRPVLTQFAEYLQAAREVVLLPSKSPEVEPENDIVVADFESGTYEGWTATGTAFGDKPQTQATIGSYQGNVNAEGKYFVNSHNLREKDNRDGDSHVGTLVSSPFKLTRSYVRMLIGGGNHQGKTCVKLVVGDKVIASLTGKANNRMELAWVDVSAVRGQEAQLHVIDDHDGGWGNIGLDQVVLTNVGPSGMVQRSLPIRAEQTADVAKLRKLNADVLAAVVQEVSLAKFDREHPLHAWAQIAFDASADEAKLAALQTTLQGQLAQVEQHAAERAKDVSVVVDYATASPNDWMEDGAAFGLGPVRPGELLLGSDVHRPLLGVATYGAARRDMAFKGLTLSPLAANDAGTTNSWVRAGQAVRTPTFTVTDGKVHYLVKGAGHALAIVDSHRMIQGPLHGEVIFGWDADSANRPRWVTQNLARYKGHRVHIEFSPKGDAPCEILMVAEGASPPALPVIDAAAAATRELAQAKNSTLQGLSEQYASMFAAASASIEKQDQTAAGQSLAPLADWMIVRPELFTPDAKKLAAEIAAIWQPAAEAEAKLAGEIKRDSRLVMAMWDGDNENERLLIRGNANTPGEIVPRRILSALGGDEQPQPQRGSGRLELASRMVDPQNPLVARVMANRIWHHLFGRGIVATVDDFGVLGERPTHPELLDHLATRFVREGWSIKRQIKAVVMTQTYQMSSNPNPAAADVDPANKLLHRMNVRRLQGEAIRDAILSVSGRLNLDQFGPSVPVHLTPFMTGRGRPRGGPPDGEGRRSIYISIRRNFLSPMMLAFDMPSPFSSMGRRTVSNVPAQALILMNDPFVSDQARLLARRVLAEEGLSPEERIEKLYQLVFSRSATEAEIADALDFLSEQGELYGIKERRHLVALDPWTDLCHVLFNVKEFVFIN